MNRVEVWSLRVSWVSKICIARGLSIPTTTKAGLEVTSRENASKRKWMVYPKRTTGARPVQFQQPAGSEEEVDGAGGRWPWWRGRCSTLYSRSSWSTCIPKYPPQDSLPQLSSDAVIANDRDSIRTLNYRRYFLLRESLLFGRP